MYMVFAFFFSLGGWSTSKTNLKGQPMVCIKVSDDK